MSKMPKVCQSRVLTVRSEKKIGDIFEVEGVKGFLEKPYEPDKLLGMIKKVIGD